MLNKEPVPIGEVDRELTALGPFIAKALAKDRDNRFASALEMARALSLIAATREGPAARLSMLPEAQSLLGGRLVTHVGASMTPAPQTVGASMTPGPQTASAPTKPDGGVQIILHDRAPAPATVPGRGEMMTSGDGHTGAMATVPRPTSPPMQSSAAASGTLPSKDLPMLDPYGNPTSGAIEVTKLVRVGVPGWFLALAIIASLLAGFLAGFAVHGRR